MFKEDYKKMIIQLAGIATHPKIFICTPTPLYGNVHKMQMNIINGPI